MNINDVVKIVICDLDDTFWKGILSEGEVEIIPENVEIVKTLINRGIMCSIVSKNDYSKAMNKLKECGIESLFIFPHINWQPKGGQVSDILNQCSLRAENALFIDDNVSNLQEVAYYNKGIMTALPNELDDLLSIEYLKGKDDINHSRLKQYKILEKRVEFGKSYSTNEEFLRNSNIRIKICDDCLAVIDRIHELVQRSNQLNFTKIRSSKEELLQLINDRDNICAYVSVKDRFGDYGIVGFYVVQDCRLVHFVFSCRTLGFGIENYIYRMLNYPDIKVVGETTTQLDKIYAENIDWIKEENADDEKVENNRSLQKILMVSGCDLDQASIYLSSDFDIDKEFTVNIDGDEIRTSDTFLWTNTLHLSDDEKKELCDNIPFLNEEISFKTKMFSHKYKTIVLSVIDDYVRGIWKHKTKGYCVAFGGFFDQEIRLKEFTTERLQYLFDNFEYTGKEDKEVFRKNLTETLDNIGNDVHILLINGIEIDVSDWIGKERVERNIEMNQVVDEIAAKYDNVDLVDMRLLATSRDCLIKKDNRHCDRSTYYKMAMTISSLCGDDFAMKSYAGVRVNHLFRKVVNKITGQTEKPDDRLW